MTVKILVTGGARTVERDLIVGRAPETQFGAVRAPQQPATLAGRAKHTVALVAAESTRLAPARFQELPAAAAQKHAAPRGHVGQPPRATERTQLETRELVAAAVCEASFQYHATLVFRRDRNQR